MITRILLYIKHHLKFLWRIIENINSLLFSFLHRKKVYRNANARIALRNDIFTCKILGNSDLVKLQNLINTQHEKDLTYFKPHGFDIKSLRRLNADPAFLMMGVFEKDKLVGYFFLRCFWNRKCFVGRLIDYKYRGKGIGWIMNNIMYNVAWDSGFRCLSTISRNNSAVMTAHSRNPAMIILKELQNDYLLVEFVSN
jgi:hypothetical protein